MKMNKKFKIGLLIGALVISAFGVIYVLSNRCNLDGESICYSDTLGRFLIEDDVALNVQVEGEAMGAYLVETWNALYPEQEGAITYTVRKPLSLRELMDELETDIVVTSIHDGAYALDMMMDLGTSVDDHILNRVSRVSQDAINVKGIKFVPNSIKGWTFVYNETMLQELGIDLTDANKDGMPDAIDSWDKIFAMESQLLEQAQYVFPLTFSDQLSFYPFLTGGKWRLNFTNKGSDPGFSHPEFLKGLSLIEEFSKVKLDGSLETQTAGDLKWAYNTVLLDRKSVFSIVSDWMLFDQMSSGSDDTFVYMPFPMYQGHNLTPLGYVDGYMVLDDVKFPSASAEVLRILRAPEAAKVYRSGDLKEFLYTANNVDELDVSDSLRNKIRALSYNDIEPVFVLENNPSVLARAILYDVDFMSVASDLFDGKITAVEAQAKFVELAKEWQESWTKE